MGYHFSKRLDVPFDQAVSRVTEALKREGFGILTDIDVKATLKNKLGADFRPYRVLGACSPLTAHCSLRTRSERCCPAMSLCRNMPTAPRRFPLSIRLPLCKRLRIRAWPRSRKRFRLSSDASSTDFKLAAVHFRFRSLAK